MLQDFAKIRQMLDRRPIGAVHVDSENLFMNATAESLTGYSNMEINTLQSWFTKLYGDAAESFLSRYLNHRTQGFSKTKHGRITRKDGVIRLLEFRACRDVAGEVWIVDDITDRVATHVELVEAKHLAEVASQAKSDFLANMSHEVRTPLNGILTMAEVMSHGDLSARQRSLLDIVRQSGNDLLYLLNDILDFSKIEAGKLELEETDFDPVQVLRATLEGFAPLAERKSLRIELDVPSSAEGLRRGDPARLRQIVANFVSNALKFTETGSVLVRLEGLGDCGGEGLRLGVHDTGPGISAGSMEFLFRKFSQVDASTTRRFGGTGLGLVICQQLAKLMGGEVWATSVEGAGSSFYATLKLPSVRACTATTQLRAPPEAQIGRLRDQRLALPRDADGVTAPKHHAVA